RPSVICSSCPSLPRCSPIATSANRSATRRIAAPCTDSSANGRPMRRLRVAQLFEQNRGHLQLTCVCGALERAIQVTQDDISPSDLVGHLNLIHPDRIQVVGTPEISWAQRLPAAKAAQHMREIMAAKPPAIIVADGCEVHPAVAEACQSTDTPLFTTPQSS